MQPVTTYDQLFQASRDNPARIGHHLVRGRLGEGGMGAVFDAVDLHTDTPVALKVLSRSDVDSNRRFKREFRAVAEISHHNLVAMLGLYEDEGILYLTMERLEGIDWMTWVRGTAEVERAPIPTPAPTWVLAENPQPHRKPCKQPAASGPASYDALREGLVQLLEGVAALHAANHLHLDIKPNNVIVDERGEEPRVVLLDFGLTTRAAAGLVPDSTHLVGGTPPFMAPEQATEEQPSPASDLYAVGVLLYQALTGRLPFAAVHPLPLLLAKAKGPEMRPSELVPGTPPDLDEMAMALLRPESDRRPSVKQLLRSLGGTEPPQPVDVPLVGRTEELTRWIEQLQREGAARVVELVAPPGAGKTRLVRAFLRRSRQDARAWFFHGRGHRNEDLPFNGFDQVLDQLASHLTRLPASVAARYAPAGRAELLELFPVFRRVQALHGRPAASRRTERRRRALGAVVEILQRVADKRALVVAIDDLQWCGRDSMRLLQLLADRLEGRVVLMITRRQDAALPWLKVPSGRYLRAMLDPLGEEERHDLARAALASVDGPERHAAAVAEAGGGNPRLTIGVARLLASHGPGAVSEAPLLDLARVRRGGLSDTARRLLRACCAADAATPLGDLADIAEVRMHPRRALGELLERDLVVLVADDNPDDARVVPAYDEVIPATLGPLSDAERAELSLRFFRQLAGEGRSPRETFAAVRHAHQAASILQPPERKVASRLALQSTEEALARGASDLVQVLARRCLELLSPTEPFARDHATAIGAAHLAAEAAHLDLDWSAEQSWDAMILAHAATAMEAAPAHERRILRRLARGDDEAAFEEARLACEALGHPLPERTAAEGTLEDRLEEAWRRVSAWLAQAPQHPGPPPAQLERYTAAQRLTSHFYGANVPTRPDLQLRLSEHLVAGLPRMGITPQTAVGLAGLGDLCAAAGMAVEAQELGRAALRAVDADPEHELASTIRVLVHACIEPWHDTEGAVARLATARDHARAHGDVVAMVEASEQGIVLSLLTQHLASAEELLQQAVSDRRAGPDAARGAYTGSLRGWLRALGGARDPAPDPAEARATFQEQTALGCWHLVLGQHQPALEALRCAKSLEPSYRAGPWTWVRDGAEALVRLALIEAGVAADHREVLGELQASFHQQCRRSITRRFRPLWLELELLRIDGEPFAERVPDLLHQANMAGYTLEHALMLGRLSSAEEGRAAWLAWGGRLS